MPQNWDTGQIVDALAEDYGELPRGWSGIPGMGYVPYVPDALIDKANDIADQLARAEMLAAEYRKAIQAIDKITDGYDTANTLAHETLDSIIENAWMPEPEEPRVKTAPQVAQLNRPPSLCPAAVDPDKPETWRHLVAAYAVERRAA